MKYTTLGQWQRRLAKLSLILVLILLFEAYKDMFSDYAGAGVQWMKQYNNNSKTTTQVPHEGDVYSEKLNTIIRNLQILQQSGDFKSVPGGLPGPDQGQGGNENRQPFFAMEGKKIPEPELNHAYSPKPCPLGRQPSVDWKHTVIPRFPLNPYKFLYPILKNEPIDQLIGLRQAILLAIRLNRTLALPYFHNHNYGLTQNYNPPIPAPLKVNVDILRHFIPIISIDELQEKCNSKFDVALLTGHIDGLPGIPSLLKAQSEIQMRMLNTMNTTVEADFNVQFGIPTFPKNMKEGEKVSFIPKRSDMLEVYPKESFQYKCAVHPYPLSALDVNLFLRKAIKLPNYKVDIEKVKNDILYSAIWYYTQPPAFIQDLATEFVEDVIHAQRTDGVFNFLCLNYHKHSESENSPEIDMITLTNILKQLIRAMRKKSKTLKISGIYISSPRSKQEKATDFRENVKIFENGDTMPIFSGKDIIAKWREKYFNGILNRPESLCSLLEDDTQDILSFVEMQVCVEAAVFVRSIGSSWAANVQANRIKTQYSDLDASMRDLLMKYKMEKKKP